MSGAYKVNAASPHLVLTLETESKPVSDNLKGMQTHHRSPKKFLTTES